MINSKGETMKAKMKDNLLERYEKECPGELKSISGKEVADFLLSIEGKEVELTFTLGDAFEKNDDNIWLPNELWDKIKPQKEIGCPKCQDFCKSINHNYCSNCGRELPEPGIENK